MVDKIWQKLLTGVMAIYYANSPGYGTDLLLSWTDGSPNLPDKMDLWAFLCFSWKFCPFFFVLVSGPFLHLEHCPKNLHHLCRLSFSWKGNFLKRCSWSALYWTPFSSPYIILSSNNVTFKSSPDLNQHLFFKNDSQHTCTCISSQVCPNPNIYFLPKSL